MITKTRLQRNVFKSNRKRQRRLIKQGLKTIEKAVLDRSKMGNSFHGFSVRLNSDYLHVSEVAARLFKAKHKDLFVKIEFDDINMHVVIEW